MFIKFFAVIGVLTTGVIIIITLIAIYRHFFPKAPIKYDRNTCPIDHDTATRFGAKECGTCGTILNDY